MKRIIIALLAFMCIVIGVQAQYEDYYSIINGTKYRPGVKKMVEKGAYVDAYYMLQIIKLEGYSMPNPPTDFNKYLKLTTEKVTDQVVEDLIPYDKDTKPIVEMAASMGYKPAKDYLNPSGYNNGGGGLTSSRETFTVKGISFVMVKVEGGTFKMGSNKGDSNEQPVHQVKLTKDYYIGETEVTQALWYKVMGQMPTSDGPQWEEKYGFGDNYPAYRVSYNDVIRFLTELNKLTGKKFRLPTEAEWEFAAKGGNKSKGYTFSGSNILGDVAWCRSNANSSSHPVKTRKANELGIYDMSGNVCEWCSDFYDNYPSSSQTDPTGPILGSKRVIRRGSWGDNEEKSPVTNRSNLSPDFRSNGMGFRLAL